MSSAFRSPLPELLSTRQARAARRGRAFLALRADLSALVSANAAGAAIFGMPADGALPTVLVRQIRSAARILAERGAAALLLRVPADKTSRPVAATATLVENGEASILLLVAENSAAEPDTAPERLLADLGLAAGEAAIFDTHGQLVAGTGPARDMAEHVLEFVSADAESRSVAIGGRAVRLFRIADDRVLGVADPKPESTAETDGLPPSGGERPVDMLEPDDEDEPRLSVTEGEASRPPRLRSLWGPLPVAEPASSCPDGIDADEKEQPETDHGIADAASGEALPGFVPRFDSPPVRFVWQIDAEGRFRSFSPEFAETVGPASAGVVGRSFEDVAERFGFDANGAIRRLLDRRDTWSGRTVLWPVENTDRRVPIDLAALPTYSRDRSFDGFRGFGIIRVVDHEADPERRGLDLRAVVTAKQDVVEPAEEASEEVAPEPPKPVFHAYEADLPGVSFGRRETPPVQAGEDAGKVVRMGADRRRASETTLSESERAAFREIGAKLGQQQAEAKTPGALRFERSSSPAPTRTRPPVIEEKRAPEPEAAPSADVAPAEPETLDAPPAFSTPVETENGADVSPDIRTVLARLPVPAIVQGLDALVFANRAFLDFAGYDDIEALNRAGGLDALFVERTETETEAHALTVRRADGEPVEASVRMQRIAFAGRSSLLMTFEHEASPAPADDAGRDLRRELAEMRAVLDIATDGVVLVDRQGTIRAANGSAQALFGTAEAELRGRPVSTLFAQESQKAVADYFETLRTKGLAGIMNDGREVIGRVAQGGLVPLFITAGRVSEERGWCVVIRDMSHWKRTEEELVNARRAAEAASLHKSRFLANISHELRTPLNAIIGFADVMASECFGPIGSERYIEYLGDIKRSGHHVLDLVNDLLDISKIEAGRMELTFESVSLNEVLTEVVSTMQPQANRERVIVRSNLPASVPPVVADRRTIRQIALNLLSNSVRFTPAGGQIIASTTYTADGSVLMRVRDSGIGMTESEIEMALTPFQQVQKPGQQGRGEGTGLGLPLTKAMVEANRADFAIRSTPGEGTLVEISFPAQHVLLD